MSDAAQPTIAGEQAPSDRDRVLRSVLRFDDADLDANRAGQPSPRQRMRLRAGWQRARLTYAAVAVINVIGAIACLFAGQQGGSLVLSLIGFAFLGINAAVVGLAAQAYLRYNRDAASGAVVVLAGYPQHTIRVAGRSLTYVLTVNDERLYVTKEVFLAIERDTTAYRFYRTPGTNTLLSVERAPAP